MRTHDYDGDGTTEKERQRMTKNISPLTGLPELPNGYFWRIAIDTYHRVPALYIRRKLWIGSREVCHASIYDYSKDKTYTTKQILDRAVHSLAVFEDDRDDNARTEALIGNYPPKKLEA